MSRGMPRSNQDLPHLVPPELAVLLTERVDRRVDDEHRHPDPLGELGHGIDHGVVALEVSSGEVPRAPPGAGEIGVTAPDPAPALRPVADQGQRRQVVDHDQVRIEPERGRVRHRDFFVRGEHGLGDGDPLTVERRLERAGRVVEDRVPDDDLPRGVDAQVLEERHEAGQHLRRPAPVAARVDVDEAPALEALGELQQEVDRASRCDVPVLLEARGGHRPAPAASASSRRAMRRVRACSRLSA